MRIKRVVMLPMLVCLMQMASGQQLTGLTLTPRQELREIITNGKPVAVTTPVPLFSYLINRADYTSSRPAEKIRATIGETDTLQESVHLKITFSNASADTLTLENVLPFSPAGSEAYITGKGNHELSRTYLFLKNRVPVNVIVPDNAWELGYNIIDAGGLRLSALTRRDRNSVRQGLRKRFETILYPGGSVAYDLYVTPFSGSWQDGLIKTFREDKLYDVDHFNDSLFQRKDLQWIRHTYVMHLMDAWDKYYYDYTQNRYTLEDFLKKGKTLYGGDDIVAIWPTWPTLGLDQRNQFDLFHDLPGGIAAMKKMAEMSRRHDTKFFICYNPWDESTRQEDHFDGLSQLIAGTSADGVVLDTRAGSSAALQAAADRVRRGVIMYSEGMAVPKDMQGIVSGRVHNALTHPPMLNLNKVIKPEFAIYRVSEINKGKITREFATSFFNGYGTEINIMAPGEPDGLMEEYSFLGRTTRILRENTFNFTGQKYTPLVATLADSIWVNEWRQGAKTVYTIFSLIPQGFNGPLFTVPPPDSASHYVDLWHHRLIHPDNDYNIPANTGAFDAAFLGTDNEGAVDCIARLPKLVTATLDGDRLSVTTDGNKGSEIRIWAGAPRYDREPVKLRPGNHEISVHSLFGRFEGDIVVQVMDKGILMDETVVTIAPGTPRRISLSVKTKPVKNIPEGMVEIPAGKFLFRTTHGDEFIGYPRQDENKIFRMPSFLADKFPVTNGQFKKFLDATKYRPADTANFLKHWKGRTYPRGRENYPVVYISYEDAKAYASWAGKRLPTEVEWQYAAQTDSLREWPWDQRTPVVRREEVVTGTLTVTHLEGIDSSRCNPGNGIPDPVGAYPDGEGKYGLQDLVGCVWQLTNDLYETASHRYIIMKGGSYFKPSSSWWYVQGGPRELPYRQYLLRVSNGFERNATVGFRCVADK